jgi:hypothetical protein
MPDSIIAALAGLCSAGFLEVLRYLLARSQKVAERSIDDATAFRHDLLARIDTLEEENGCLVKDRGEWQHKYYLEREERVKAQWQLQTMSWIAQELESKKQNTQDESK